MWEVNRDGDFISLKIKMDWNEVSVDTWLNIPVDTWRQIVPNGNDIAKEIDAERAEAKQEKPKCPCCGFELYHFHGRPICSNCHYGLAIKGQETAVAAMEKLGEWQKIGNLRLERWDEGKRHWETVIAQGNDFSTPEPKNVSAAILGIESCTNKGERSE